MPVGKTLEKVRCKSVEERMFSNFDGERFCLWTNQRNPVIELKTILGKLEKTFGRVVGEFSAKGDRLAGIEADRLGRTGPSAEGRLRSEERRVGKECRCQGAPRR